MDKEAREKAIESGMYYSVRCQFCYEFGEKVEPYLCPKCEMRIKQLGYHKLPSRPPIVCLCGSTRFTDEMLVKQWELTKQGLIVLSWCALPEAYFSGGDKTHIGDQEDVKEIVDEVHLRKIDLADEVLVVNLNGYIGESTRREIDYAEKQGKRITYLESPSSTGS